MKILFGVFATAFSLMATLNSAVSNELSTLRNIQGHWQGGDYNPQVDSPNGRKYILLVELGKELGVTGTPFEKILNIMKEPDEIIPEKGAPLMPGPVVDAGVGKNLEGLLIVKYYWRGIHDYLWFGVNNETGLVEKSGWYHALE